MKVFVFALLLAAANALVVFEPYSNSLCTVNMFSPGKRLYLPVTDRNQGIDPQVASVIYSGNPPSNLGSWTNVTSTSATLCSPTNVCQTFPVWAQNNLTDCRLVPSFGYGRFYNHAGAGVLELYRTTGQTTTFDYQTCLKPENSQWVAYVDLNVVSSSAACTTSTVDPQWFWDGGDKLVFYRYNQPTWTKTQPCGAGPYPGEKCFTSGEGYCTKNINCAIDHTNAPVTFPFFAALATTVKVVTENKVGFVPGAGPVGGGAAAALAPGAVLLLLALGLLY